MPTAAGAHSPGVEKAPGALRLAGLIDSLNAARLAVSDYGDLEPVPFTVDRDHRRAQNAAAVARVARAVALRTAQALRAGATPLVVGGDCTILLGVLAGCIEAGSNVGLVYLDAHPDLNTPDSVVQGALDWMGMAHVLGWRGARRAQPPRGPRAAAGVGRRRLLRLRGERADGVGTEELAQPTPSASSRPAVAGHARRRPPARRAACSRRAEQPFVVHFDVDALDYVDIAMADNAYQRNQGLTLDEALASVEVFAASTLFAGLVLTEVNPDHVPTADLLRDFAYRLAAAIMPAATPARPLYGERPSLTLGGASA